jgi:chromosome partitioning protein
MKGRLPLIVTWHGRCFDIPVILHRSLLHGVSAAPWFQTIGSRYDGYAYRYGHRHIDLMDVIHSWRRSDLLGPIINMGSFWTSAASPQPEVLTGDAVKLESLLEVFRKKGVKWVFLDLPGRAHPISGAGMSAAELVIIPCRPLDVDIEASLDTVNRAKRSKKPYAYLMNIAHCQSDKKQAKKVGSLLRAAGHPVVGAIIVQRVDVPYAIADGLGVNEANPNSPSDKEFAELFKWIAKEVGGKK